MATNERDELKGKVLSLKELVAYLEGTVASRIMPPPVHPFSGTDLQSSSFPITTRSTYPSSSRNAFLFTPSRVKPAFS
jgi:hypothetical protein